MLPHRRPLSPHGGHCPMTSANPAIPAKNLRWYQGLDRYCWIVLTIAALGWLFDTMDQNLFNLVRTASLTEMLAPAFPDPVQLKAEVTRIGGLVTAAFLVGW